MVSTLDSESKLPPLSGEGGRKSYRRKVTRRNGSERTGMKGRGDSHTNQYHQYHRLPQRKDFAAGVGGEFGFLKGGINLRDLIGGSLKVTPVPKALCIV